MEALADFGAVNLLNYRALTDAIYRVWYGAFDQAAALQLATVLVSLALALVALERLLRGRARYHQALARGDAVVPRRLRGPAAWLAAALPLLLLALVVVAPGGPAARLGGRGRSATARRPARSRARRSTACCSPSVAAVVAVVAATVVAYGAPRAPVAASAACRARLGALGYAVPGTVVAVAVYVPLAWMDRPHRRRSPASGCCSPAPPSGSSSPTSCASTALALLLRRGAHGARSTRRSTTPRAASAPTARACSPTSTCRCWGRASRPPPLLVFVEVMKELPATALLRPLGGDTLAIAVWEATRDSRFEVAALPALLIVAVGLVPVVLAIRYSRGDAGAPDRAERRTPRPRRGPRPRAAGSRRRRARCGRAGAQARGALGVGVPGGHGGGLGKGLRPLVSGSSKAWRSQARSSAMRRGRGASASGFQGSSSRRRSGTPGGRVSATPRAASQSG